ncbi:hypothetical protein F503_03753 [Ophiostoma piceae UAMH 11346]|uniref:Uncharacterized protein n=1 Tax=Ophiostoma piceae (strain UAMH 11346) TaxID=1262450 RepID=S3CFT5_OPHP1|nr:hypothetical protein F503_03753 [Ophiostoma piceae UAMH 11346]
MISPAARASSPASCSFCSSLAPSFSLRTPCLLLPSPSLNAVIPQYHKTALALSVCDQSTLTSHLRPDETPDLHSGPILSSAFHIPPLLSTSTYLYHLYLYHLYHSTLLCPLSSVIQLIVVSIPPSSLLFLVCLSFLLSLLPFLVEYPPLPLYSPLYHSARRLYYSTLLSTTLLYSLLPSFVPYYATLSLYTLLYSIPLLPPTRKPRAVALVPVSASRRLRLSLIRLYDYLVDALHSTLESPLRSLPLSFPAGRAAPNVIPLASPRLASPRQSPICLDSLVTLAPSRHISHLASRISSPHTADGFRHL